MKAIAIADAFMKEAYYREGFLAFPRYTLMAVPFFGEPDRYDMRGLSRRIERMGPEAAEPPAEVYDLIGEAEVLMSHLCPISERLLSRASRLELILSNRGGLENIDMAAATARGIPVLHNPAHNANSVAELTIGLILSEMRNISRTHGKLMVGEWCESFRNAGAVYEVCGKTVGIIGFGNIGRRVARKLTVFDCNVLVCDPFIEDDDDDLARFGCTRTDIQTLLENADIITLHARAEEVVLNAPLIARMKRGAYFINTARPHLIDHDAIVRRLREGELMGAAFDVFPTEPIPEGEPLLTLDNVTLTNHRGGATENCYMDSPAALLRHADQYLAGGDAPFFANRKALGMR